NSKQVEDKVMTINNLSETAKAVVRRNTEEVQGGGDFEVFEELFADDFLDHTPQPGRTPDKDGARQLYKILWIAFPDFDLAKQTKSELFRDLLPLLNSGHIVLPRNDR